MVSDIRLSGRQMEKLQKALIDAFPRKSLLEQMLLFKLDKNLREIAGEGSLQDIVFELITKANSQGEIEDLIRSACEANPGNPLLKEVSEELLGSSPFLPIPDIGQTDNKGDSFSRKLAVIVGVITTGTIFSIALLSELGGETDPTPNKITSTPEPSQESTSTVEDYFQKGRKQYNLGKIKFKNRMYSEASQDYNKAIQHYNEAIELNPNEADYYYYRGRARWELKNYKGAIEDCTQAIKLKPDNANYYYDCGLARRYSGDDKGAIEDFQEAIRLSKEKGDEELRKKAQKQLDGICKNSKEVLRGCKTS